MKKIFLPVILFCLLSIIFTPFLVKAAIVPCTDNCGIQDFFVMLANIYSFIVIDIAVPLGVIAVAVGGILMMVSAGNPSLMGKGKEIFYAAIIGLVLVFCSWLIINFIMTTVGYQGSWSSF